MWLRDFLLTAQPPLTRRGIRLFEHTGEFIHTPRENRSPEFIRHTPLGSLNRENRGDGSKAPCMVSKGCAAVRASPWPKN